MTAPIDFGEVLEKHSACGVTLSYTEYGFMQFDSSKIVLFDAYSAAHRYSPFDVECGIVAFPFYCGCMTDGGERVAYCGLRFGEEKAKEWKLLRLNEALGLLNVDPDAAGVPITSGVCCIADEKAYNEYYSHLNDEVHPLAGLIVLNGQTHTTVELFGKKYAVFSSGWGDGRYKCYAGMTADGRVTAIVVDFGMIEYPKADDTPVEVEIEADARDIYVYDPEKSESENNILRWSQILESSTDPAERLRAYSRRGYAYHSENKIDAALADYTAAVECSKSVTDRGELLRAWSVYDNAAEIFCARSNYEAAIKLMTDALCVGDNFYTGAFVRLIDLYQLTKRTDKAIEIAEEMLGKRPEDPVAHIKYAECCVSAMDYKNAAKTFEQLASKFRLYENLFDEASCLIELGEYDQAEAALERHPAKEYYEQYWYYKAYIDFKKNDYRAALENVEKSHEIDKEYMPALYLLIDIESVLHDYLSVARYAEAYKRLRPDNEYGYNICAEAHLVLGNFSECARNYCYLYDNIKKDDKYAALAAMLCNKSGDKKNSKRMLRILKRKMSAYYLGAVFGVSSNKSNDRSAMLDRILLRLKDDIDFLLSLSMFMVQSNCIYQASRILDYLSGNNQCPPHEILAQQITIAERTGNKQQFMSYIFLYIEKFVSKNTNVYERRKIAERFMLTTKKHKSWLTEIVSE